MTALESRNPPLKIRSVEYATTLATPDGEIPGDLRGETVQIDPRDVSAQPGKTQAINFYRVNDEFFLVDLPGFGYAKVPKAMRDSWQGLVEGYLGRSMELRGVVHLVDARRTPGEQDLEMLDYLAQLKIPTLVVLTKVDKLKSSQRKKAFDKSVATMGLDPEQVVSVSSKTGEGREVLLAALRSLLEIERA